MRLLDLFSGAGGCAMGYHRAGFDEIVGVDIEHQKRYPFHFVQADALEYCAEHGHEFDAIHASPPCQFASEATPMEYRSQHHNYIPSTRKLLRKIGKPYVIENVEGARRHLVKPVMICGTMLGLPVWRHRYFETWSFWLMSPASCAHTRKQITVNIGGEKYHTWNPILCTGGGDGKRSNRRTHRPREAVDVIRWAMDIDWMTQQELSQAVPPAYTKFIGRHLLQHIERCTQEEKANHAT